MYSQNYIILALDGSMHACMQVSKYWHLVTCSVCCPFCCKLWPGANFSDCPHLKVVPYTLIEAVEYHSGEVTPCCLLSFVRNVQLRCRGEGEYIVKNNTIGVGGRGPADVQLSGRHSGYIHTSNGSGNCVDRKQV